MAIIKPHERLGRGARCSCCLKMAPSKIRAADARRARRLARQLLKTATPRRGAALRG